MTKTNISSV